MQWHAGEKTVIVAPKIGFLICGFFCWLGIEHLYWHQEKKIDLDLKFWGKNWRISIFGSFLLKNEQKGSSESHIAPESPSIFFTEFGSPKSVQLGTSVDFWGTRRNFGHFWPYLAKYQNWHFWQKSYPHNFLQYWVRTSIFLLRTMFSYYIWYSWPKFWSLLTYQPNLPTIGNFKKWVKSHQKLSYWAKILHNGRFWPQKTCINVWMCDKISSPKFLKKKAKLIKI